MSAKVDTNMLKHLEDICAHLGAALENSAWKYDRLDAALYELSQARECVTKAKARLPRKTPSHQFLIADEFSARR